VITYMDFRKISLIVRVLIGVTAGFALSAVMFGAGYGIFAVTVWLMSR